MCNNNNNNNKQGGNNVCGAKPQVTLTHSGLNKVVSIAKAMNLLCLGNVKTSKPVNLLIQRRAWFDEGTCNMTVRRARQGTVSNIEAPIGSIGMKMGLRPEVLLISLPKGQMPESIMRNLIGHADINDVAYRNKRTGLLRFKPITSILHTKGVENIMSSVLKAGGIQGRRVIPAHPSMIVSGAKNEFCVIINKDDTKTWADFCNVIGITSLEDMSKLAIRAGKDIWSIPLSEVDMTVKVVAPTGKAHDGNMFVRKGIMPSKVMLTRFIPLNGKKADIENFYIGKGRVIEVSDEVMANLGASDVDCITTTDNLKWMLDSSTMVGKTSIVRALLVKDEMVPKKDSYSFNAVGLLMAKLTPKSRRWVLAEFKKRYEKISNTFLNPAGNLLHNVENILNSSEDNSMQLSELKAKYAYNMISKSELATFQKLELNRGKSISVKGGLNTKIIFAADWMGTKVGRGEFIASNSVYTELEADNNMTPTCLRSPVVSYQNYMKLSCVAKSDELPGYMIIMNPDDAQHCQGDGDDHLIIYPRCIESTYTPKDGDEVFTGRTDNLGYASVTISGLYLKGAASQQMIGTIFNLMMINCAARLNKGDNLLDTFRVFGGALDIAAQGIKKNMRLPNLNNLRDIVTTSRKSCPKGMNLEYAGAYLGHYGDTFPSIKVQKEAIVAAHGVIIPDMSAPSNAEIARLLTVSDTAKSEVTKFVSTRYNNPISQKVDFEAILLKLVGATNFGKLVTVTKAGNVTAIAAFRAYIDIYAYCYSKVFALNDNLKLDIKYIMASQAVVDPENPKDGIKYTCAGFVSKTEELPLLTGVESVKTEYDQVDDDADVIIGKTVTGNLCTLIPEDVGYEVYIGDRSIGSVDVSGIGHTARGNKMSLDLDNLEFRVWPVN